MFTRVVFLCLFVFKLGARVVEMDKQTDRQVY